MIFLKLHTIKTFQVYAISLLIFPFTSFSNPENNGNDIQLSSAIPVHKNAATDTVKIKKMIALGYQQLKERKPDSAIVLGLNAYRVSDQNNFSYGIGHSQLILAKAYNAKKAYPQALSYYLKSSYELQNSGNISIVSNINYEIGTMYHNWEVYEKAIEYFRVSDQYNQNNTSKHFTVLQAMATSFVSLNYPDSAIQYYTQVIDYHNSKNDLKSAIAILEAISLLHKNIKQYDLSIESELKILEYYEKLEIISGQISTLNNLGFLYKYIDDFDKSLSYFKKAIELSKGGHQRAAVYINIAVIYHNKGDYESALKYMFDALKISRANKNLSETAKVYNLLASTYFLLQDIETAANYVKMAIEIGEKTTDLDLLHESYLIVSNIYQAEGNFEVALEYYTKYANTKQNINESDQHKQTEVLAKKYAAEKTEKELKLYMAEEEIKDLALKQLLLENEKREKELFLQKENNILLQNKYELEKATSDQRLQLINQKLTAEKKDREISELNSDKKIQDLALKQKEIEKNEQEKEIQLLESNNMLLEQEKQLDKLKDEKNKVFRNLLIAGILIALFVLLSILYLYKRKLKTNKLLLAKNTEISEQKISIERQANELQNLNKNLKELDRFKESLTGMMVHDLKNPLNSILNTSPNERVKTLANKMLLMVMNILDIQKFEDAALELEIKPVLLLNLAEIAIEQVIKTATEKNIEIINEIPVNNIVKIDQDIIERVFTNLLTNAIKYTPVNGSIVMNATTVNNKWLQIEVSDTGQGIPKDKIHLVFDKFGQVDAKNFGKTRSSGLGLSFCKLAIEAHGGDIGVVSEAGEGATFWFTIEKSQISDLDAPVKQKADSSKNVKMSASTYLVLKPFISRLQHIKYYEITELRKVLAQINGSMLNNIEISEWKNELTNAISSGNKLLYNDLINLNIHEAK